MKRFILIISCFAAMLTAVASCEKESVTEIVDPVLIGEWKLVSAVSEGKDMSEVMPEVYISIKAEGSFELFQKSGTQSLRFDRYTGTCFTENGLLTGTYSNGEAWAGKWKYSASGNSLILESFNLLEVNTYEKTEIPQQVRAEANDIMTKSSQSAFAPIL